MADAVIGAIVEVSLSKAISILEEQINLAWEFKDELNKLRASLALTQAFLQDAVSRHLDAPLKVWLEQLRGIASEADDVLDELAYEHLRKKVEENQTRRKVSNFIFPSKNRMKFTIKMAKKVNKIKQSMDDINRQASDLGLQQRVPNMGTPSIGVGDYTHCFGDSSQVIGRDVDVMKVADMLTSSTNRQPFSIVSIVGMAGLGKTTLAKLVCNNERVKNRFNKIMWVCVAENFDVQRILQEMVESLSEQTCELRNRNAILGKLKKVLEEKTYLLVLDDVWDVNFKNWEELRSSLLGINEDNKGISILVTTRSENVALVRETLPENRHHLKAIVDDECWSLIKERAFGNCSISQELEVIGRDIARKCKGVPLVATVIGGTMCNQRDKDEWVSIRDSSLWGSLERDEIILSVLKLSYERLPSSSLKQCFVYCSVFPKDFRIQKKQLIELWMAEGLLQQSKRNSMVVDEDIGDEYFMNLLSNSLLQDVELDEYGCISTCKMHDLVHDLARSIQDVQKLTPKINYDGSYKNVLDNDVKLWHSLFLKTDINRFAGNFNGLRVLSLCEANISSLPDSIGGLKHLRYFDISRTRISTIPKSLTELYHLQTFRLLKCYFLKFPEGMKNLVSLRHLYVSRNSSVFDDIEFYKEIKCLTSLQILPIVEARMGWGIGVLESLNALGGELVVTNLEFVRNKEEARKAKLWEKNKLHELVYDWGWGIERDENKDEEVLEGLEPHPNLKSLTIRGYKGGQYPSWFRGIGVIRSLSNLVELNLTNCENLKSVPTLGQYLNLKFLRIFGLQKVRSIGNEFYHTSDQKTSKLFSSLEVFSLENMRKLEEWLGMEAAVFPSLKNLEIRSCPKLISIPIMSRFSSLKRLCIDRCSELRWSEDEPFLFPSRLQNLNISDCSNLNCIPSVESGISSLQELYVENCEKLSAIEEGLLASTVLRYVCIRYCPSLTSISFIGGSPSLVELEIFSCDELREIKGGLQLQKLKEFTINSCLILVSIPSMEGFSLLSKLRINGCKELVSLPSGLQTCTSLESLCIGFCSKLRWSEDEPFLFPSRLRKLEISDCSNLNCIPSVESGISSLQELYVSNCEKLSAIEERLLASTVLRDVCVRYCPSLTSISFNGGSQSLVKLEIDGCDELREIKGGLQLQKLEEFTIGNCLNLVSIPSMEGFSLLSKLIIYGCKELVILPSGLQTCTSLEDLCIVGCSNLKSIPEGSLGSLTSLKTLELGGFSEDLEEFPSITSVHSSVRDLTLRGWEKLISLPHQLQQCTALEELRIQSFNGMKALPEWLGNLSSLRRLEIYDCNKLEHLPSEETMQRLPICKWIINGCTHDKHSERS